jgi:hypothetical protein
VVVRFGALAVIVLTIAIDPLAQQLVQIDQEMRFKADNDGQVRVPCAERYSKGSSVAIANTGYTNVYGGGQPLGTYINDDGRLVDVPLVFQGRLGVRSGNNGSVVTMTMLGTTNSSQTVTMGHVDTPIWSQSVIKAEATNSSGI